MRASQIGRPHFFEIFTLLNFAVLLFALRDFTWRTITTLPTLVPYLAAAFVAEALIGIAIRLAFAARRGAARELLASYRSSGWMVDTLRMAIINGLAAHTYGWIKLMMPVFHPRLFDQQLWKIDQVICFGYSPNVFLLTLFSTPVMLRAIDWSYAFIFFASINVVTIFFASVPERRTRIVFMNSYILLWLIGAWLYVAVPTLGPAYRFPGVWLPMAPLLTRTQYLQHQLISNYNALLILLHGGREPADINILFGVAAFPSLHVGFQVLAFLWMRRLTKWGGTVFGLCALFIFIGSIVTGWHYLIDGIAGAALAWACYAAARRVPAIRA